jgi:probable DNA metabolism protein
MSISLNRLLLLLGNDETPECQQNDLFGFSEGSQQYEQFDIDIICSMYSTQFDCGLLNRSAWELFEHSIDAFYALVHAWMSERCLAQDMLAYGRKILAEAKKTPDQEAARKMAQAAAKDRGNPAAVQVLLWSGKVYYEYHRLLGFLRFAPEDGIYTARCAPDHFILPAMGEHFTLRFGETAWNIIDEKRQLRLGRMPGDSAKIYRTAGSGGVGKDEWQELWRHYHKTINNESRKNLKLQRQFMPLRYQKYLNEL